MKELIFYICGIFSCMIVWFLWAIIASKKAKEAPLKEYARIHIDIEKAWGIKTYTGGSGKGDRNTS